jgi:hypothetical protein
MVNTNAVRGHLHVIEADLANQRLLALIFTPGANDFHDNLTQQA